jgi:transcriptional regulator with XRE-family HTH domain
MKLEKPTSLPSNFIANIKRLRRELNLSQTKFAKRCGLSQGYVSLMESGERTPTFDMIDRIAKALEVTPESLLSKVA